MIINVIDVEATCWDRRVDTPSEVIQIGISQLDTRKKDGNKRGTISEPFSVFVRPIHSFALSDFCKNLTGLTDEQVFGKGMMFTEAMALLDEKFSISRFPWASWGDYDRAMLQREADDRVMVPVLNRQHLNIKLMFHVVNDHRCGVEKAMGLLGMSFEGRPHDGGDDAYNIARILRELLPQKPR